MARFFTSDLHLSHANIITFCDRPYKTVVGVGPRHPDFHRVSVDWMNIDLVRRWNMVVGADDEVIIVGDLAMGRLDESLAIVGDLNGHKKLVPGNHDRMFNAQGLKYRSTADRYLAAGIDEILEQEFELTIEGRTYLVCHFPYQGDSQSKEGHEDRYQEQRPVDRGMRLIHGHTHGIWRKLGHMVDVGVDAWGGLPVHELQLHQTFEQDGNLDPLPW